MSFTRRNIAIRTPAHNPATQPTNPPAPQNNSSGSQQATPQPAPPSSNIKPRLPGTRPSPIDSRPTTSTGCSSLDGLLAGHAGLPLGTSLLLGESGTTDYAATLLRYYAAEGVVQGQRVHVVGVSEAWGRDLPAAVGAAGRAGDGGEGVRHGQREGGEKMKIAWRYERLGEFGDHGNTRTGPGSEAREEPFCHSFDLTKRLTFPSHDIISYIPIRPDSLDPFDSIKQNLTQALQSTPPNTVHRIVIPSLLSPAIWPAQSSKPGLLLPFLHFLRALLRTRADHLSLMLSLPLTLYPRESGLTRWIELLSDGVLELVPFPHVFDNQVSSSSLGTSGAATAQEERPQGMLRVHRLPRFHERGGGGVGSAGVEDDLAFTVSRRKFVIKPFSLPPVEGDTEARKGEAEGSARPRKEDLEF